MVRFQKLTRNPFLTLYGHNVHRQQQQLSKFLVRYQHSKRSTQKAFSCCDAILETGPAVSMRSEVLVAHEKLAQLLLLTVYVVPV